MEKKSIVMYVILSIVTCGIFGLYWYYTVAKTYEDAQLQSPVGTTAGISLLLNIVTCGIYGIYTYYKWGANTPELFSRFGKAGEDKSIMYLILSLFGFSIINLCLIQNDFNQLADGYTGGGTQNPGASYGNPYGSSYPTAQPPVYPGPSTPGFGVSNPAPSATPPAPPAPPVPPAPEMAPPVAPIPPMPEMAPPPPAAPNPPTDDSNYPPAPPAYRT